MNFKLKTIYSLLDKDWKIICDIGCDHALLSQYSYKIKDSRHFINVDNKNGPISMAINNHKNINNDAEFILSDGKDFLKKLSRNIDCCIIAGIGGINCLDILNSDSNYIKNYILQVDNNQEIIDSWILENNFCIKEIKNIKVKNHKYNIYKISKND